MRRFVKNRSRKAGLPPGSLVHIGEKKSETTRLTRMDYDEQSVTEPAVAGPEACRPPPGAGVSWINVVGVHDADVLDRIGEVFSLHPLVREDILNTDQRPKLEDYGEYAYIVLKHLVPGGNGSVGVEQVSLVLGKGFVISFEESDSALFQPVRERIRANRGRIRKEGADYLVYSLLDAVVDNYFIVLEGLGERIEGLQESLILRPTPAGLHSLSQLRREMIELRRSVWPLRDVLGMFERGTSGLVQSGTWIYLRDVYDHTAHVIDTIETYRDMLSGMLDIYLSSVTNRLNEVMKVLTIITTVLMPATLVAGIYGMNFRHMPELEWRWGYPVALGLMLLFAGVMVWYFRKKRWF
jgi:magnesium transporter